MKKIIKLYGLSFTLIALAINILKGYEIFNLFLLECIIFSVIFLLIGFIFSEENLQKMVNKIIDFL